jgi:outer membrane protein OmpA-like peptidoglycan-associated protein
VRDYFIKQGVAPARVRAKGFGETNPVASNDTVEGRAMNRRVELHPDK